MEKYSIPNIQNIKSREGGETYLHKSTIVSLPQWIGYFSNYMCTERIMDGQFSIGIDNVIESSDDFTPSQAQVNAYYYLTENHDAIKESILLALANMILQDYEIYDPVNLPKLSDLTHGFDFKNYIGPRVINISTDIKDEFAYITWHFHCLWDSEHGFEVITHKNRIIDIGIEADAFKINEDNGTAEEAKYQFGERLNTKTGKKKWWKFW